MNTTQYSKYFELATISSLQQLMNDGRKITVQAGRELIKEGSLDVHVLLGLETNFPKKCNKYFTFLV